MKKYVPMEKRSKKEQRAWYASQRGSWNGVKPVSRTIPSKKLYNRKRTDRREDFPGRFVFLSKQAGILRIPARIILMNGE